MRRFFRPTLRRPFPVFLVPKLVLLELQLAETNSQSHSLADSRGVAKDAYFTYAQMIRPCTAMPVYQSRDSSMAF